MKYSVLFLLAFMMLACKDQNKSAILSASEIINKSINVSGGDAFDHSLITFDFRAVHYSAKRHNGLFEFKRFTRNEEGDSVIDVLNNKGFKRLLEARDRVLSDSLAALYTASVNSVHYFSVLPYGLNDQAVIKELLGEETIKTKSYYKVKIRFKAEGEGEDYQDIFIYWIGKQTFKVDYLAYSYKEDDGMGMRFRVAYNERYVNGLRFVDYNNYKSKTSSIALEDLGKAFDNEQLELLSKIELKNISVELLDTE